MVLNAPRVIGSEKVNQMIKRGLLGHNVDKASGRSISHFTTVYRQDIVFNRMKEIVLGYLQLWYT
jgi:hypothetical protein